MEKRIVITFVAFASLACILLFVKLKCNVDKAIPVIVISPDTIYAGESISFADTAMAATNYEWNFGDQSVISADQKGTHQYKNVGNYTVKLNYNSNSNIVFDKTIVVLAVPEVPDTSQFEIEGPIKGVVNQSLSFKAIVKDESTTLFEWRFGESGTIDSRDRNATYAYSKPDNYEISLRVNNSRRFAKRTIIIKPRTTTPYPSIASETLEQLFLRYVSVCNDDLARNSQKKEILKYFCGLNSSTVIDNITTETLNDFLRDLCLMNKKSVKIIRMTKSSSNCINLIEVQSQ